MKIAAASGDGVLVDKHFGHAESFYIFEADRQTFRPAGVRQTERFCTKESNHGKANGVMEKFVKLLGDCEILLCESIGYTVAAELSRNGIQPYMLHCEIATAIKAWQEGLLDFISEDQNG